MLTIDDIKLGDKVMGKYTGVGVAAKVVGIATYECYASGYVRTPNLESKAWEKFAPDYKNEPVVLAIFETPQKNMRREELEEHIKESTTAFIINLQKDKELWDLFIDNQYNALPAAYIVAYNIKDVIKL